MCLVVGKPDLLLLTQSQPTIWTPNLWLWLERHLQEYPGTVILVTHDRYFLDNVVRWILEIDNGRGVPWEGNYSSWLEQKERKLIEQNRAKSKRQTLARELAWIRMGSQKRSLRNKSRIRQYDQLLMDIESGEFEQRRLDIAIPLSHALVTPLCVLEGFAKALVIGC